MRSPRATAMVTETSPLSVPPSSFYTAPDNVMADAEDGASDMSGPDEADPLPYRDARQLPLVLREHVKVLLEEKMCKC